MLSTSSQAPLVAHAHAPAGGGEWTRFPRCPRGGPPCRGPIATSGLITTRSRTPGGLVSRLHGAGLSGRAHRTTARRGAGASSRKVPVNRVNASASGAMPPRRGTHRSRSGKRTPERVPRRRARAPGQYPARRRRGSRRGKRRVARTRADIGFAPRGTGHGARVPGARAGIFAPLPITSREKRQPPPMEKDAQETTTCPTR